jgi:cob(I)alamin adenosyltransferase
MKIYTKTGDGGATALLGGQRVSKCDPSPEACGCVDELNAELGALASMIDGHARARLIAEIHRVQRRLFSVGSCLASRRESDAIAAGVNPVGPRDYAWLETSIDAMQAELKPLQAFILPGGCAAAIQAHRARTVCRRAERRTVALAEYLVDINGCHHVQEEQRYLNRLADYLFVVARYCNHCAGEAEFEWQSEAR